MALVPALVPGWALATGLGRVQALATALVREREPALALASQLALVRVTGTALGPPASYRRMRQLPTIKLERMERCGGGAVHCA